jgi:hypothetical protein
MSILIVISVIVLGVIACDVLRNYQKLKKYNQHSLDINTWDGHKSPYHPSVLYFAEAKFGWHYWMVETPFYKKPTVCPYRDRYECPSIHVSNDGIHWMEPTKKPIVNLANEEIAELNYYSDPHLLVNGSNEIECWFRYNRRHGDRFNDEDVTLCRCKTSDGIHWSEIQHLVHCELQHKDINGLGRMLVSPSVLYLQNAYWIWYVDSIERTKLRHVQFATSKTATRWQDKQNVSFRGADVNPWHIDVSCWDNVFWMVVYDMYKLTLWRSDDGISFDFVRTLLVPSHRIGCFYADGLYRACLIKTESCYRLYFSADHLYNTYLGVMEGDSPEKLDLISIDGKKQHNVCSFVRPYISKQMVRLRFLIQQ